MTPAQKKKWYKIYGRLVDEVNDREFKTRSGYRNAMSKVYDKAIAEYLKHNK